MKKYNHINLKSLLIWVVLPILTFLLAFTGVYAYFTATATNKSTTRSVGIVKIGISGDVYTATAASLTVNYVLPGGSVTARGTVQNIGDEKLYAILQMDIYVVDESDNETLIITKYYTLTNTELKLSEGKYITDATTLDVSGTASYNLTHTFGFHDFTNEYQGQTVLVNISAKAIQFKNITDAATATNLIMGISPD